MRHLFVFFFFPLLAAQLGVCRSADACVGELCAKLAQDNKHLVLTVANGTGQGVLVDREVFRAGAAIPSGVRVYFEAGNGVVIGADSRSAWFLGWSPMLKSGGLDSHLLVPRSLRAGRKLDRRLSIDAIIKRFRDYWGRVDGVSHVGTYKIVFLLHISPFQSRSELDRAIRKSENLAAGMPLEEVAVVGRQGLRLWDSYVLIASVPGILTLGEEEWAGASHSGYDPVEKASKLGMVVRWAEPPESAGNMGVQ